MSRRLLVGADGEGEIAMCLNDNVRRPLNSSPCIGCGKTAHEYSHKCDGCSASDEYAICVQCSEQHGFLCVKCWPTEATVSMKGKGWCSVCMELLNEKVICICKVCKRRKNKFTCKRCQGLKEYMCESCEQGAERKLREEAEDKETQEASRRRCEEQR